MRFEGRFMAPDGKNEFLYAISAPEPSKTAPYECRVLLKSLTSGNVLVDSPIFGEDSFQALHCATELIHTLSGWKAHQNELENE